MLLDYFPIIEVDVRYSPLEAYSRIGFVGEIKKKVTQWKFRFSARLYMEQVILPYCSIHGLNYESGVAELFSKIPDRRGVENSSTTAFSPSPSNRGYCLI